MRAAKNIIGNYGNCNKNVIKSIQECVIIVEMKKAGFSGVMNRRGG